MGHGVLPFFVLVSSGVFVFWKIKQVRGEDEELMGLVISDSLLL